jgi:hypothetical protein
MKQILLSISLSLLILPLASVLVGPEPLFAQNQNQVIRIIDQRSDNDANTAFGLPKVVRSIGDSTIAQIVGVVMLVAGSLSVLFIAIGGLRYVLSEGNDQKIAQAKNTILYAIVGLVVSISAFLVVRFVIGGLF